MKLPKQFEFLKSVRFYNLVVIAILQVLRTEGILANEVVDALALIVQYVLGGSTIIRTVDRFSETIK